MQINIALSHRETAVTVFTMIQRLTSFAESTADRLMNLRRYSRPAGTPPPPIVAHRGAWDASTCAENTMRAFTRARDCGVGAIELDVHFSRDNVPVIHHDSDLRRVFAHPGRIEDMTIKEIRAVTAEVPTLADVLALSGLHFMIEIKTPLNTRHLDIIKGCLSGRAPVRDYHLLTLDKDLVRASAISPPESWILVGQLSLADLVKCSVAKGYAGVAGHYLGMTNSLVAQLHARGQKAGVGFVPTKNLYHREWGRGIDWVFTNSARQLRAELA